MAIQKIVIFFLLSVFPGFESASLAGELSVKLERSPLHRQIQRRSPLILLYKGGIYNDFLSPKVQLTQTRLTFNNLIQEEIYHSLRRLYPFLNTWILVSVLIPTATVISISIWFFRLAQKTQVCYQNLDSVKYDSLSYTNYMASEAQDVVYDIYESVQVTEETIHSIDVHLQSLSTQDSETEESTLKRE